MTIPTLKKPVFFEKTGFYSCKLRGAATWERRLFRLAHEPLQHAVDVAASSATANDSHVGGEINRLIKADTETLERAYARCVAITREHSKTFYMASGLLPPAKRQAMRALYAFCRISDDLVDRTDGNPLVRLEAWRERALGAHPGRSRLQPSEADASADSGATTAWCGDTTAWCDNTTARCDEHSLVALAWTDARTHYQIPAQYAHQLIDGVAMDVKVTRYEAFDDLAEYAYGVASTVGLMAMHIVGFARPNERLRAIPYAVKLGVALQITNILRDVGEDWHNGRLYLPQEELSAFGLRQADIAAGQVDDRWRALMRFQIARNRRLYDEAMPGIAMLHRDGRFAITAAAELYRAILEDIEAHDMDVFSRRAHVSRWGKLRRLPGIWWRTHRR